MYRWLLAGLLGLTFTLSASAATYRYGTPVSVTGTLGSRQGVDCCNMGKEEVVEFPAIILDHPINTIPADRQDEEGPVNGVLIMQLVKGNDSQWKFYKNNQGHRARLTCSMFVAQTGHHLTQVLCNVDSMKKASPKDTFR